MAKNCLNKISGNITVGCTIPQVGVKNIYLMYAEDVSFTYNAPGIIQTAVFAGSAKVYNVEGYKQNIQVTASLKTTDASARVDQSVTFKVPYATNYATLAFLNSVALGKFYVFVVYNDGDYAMLGATSPLECSSVDFDSNANARMATVTLASPEGSAGNSLVPVSPAARDLIISKSV